MRGSPTPPKSSTVRPLIVAGWGCNEGESDGPSELEIDNGLRQTDRVFALVDEHSADPSAFMFSSELICELNRLAVDGIEETAGSYRLADVDITGSSHVPPPWQDVPQLVEAMCATLAKESGWNGLRRAAYVLWRTNWIHPFADGNGRTARALSYLVLCLDFMRGQIPGRRAITERIRDDKRAYYMCLAEADAGWKKRKQALLLTNLEQFLGKHVRLQIEAAERDE